MEPIKYSVTYPKSDAVQAMLWPAVARELGAKYATEEITYVRFTMEQLRLGLDGGAEGIDVSRHQGRIDWEQVGKAGLALFAYARASMGATGRDERFAENWQGAKGAGLLRGAYHYFISDVDPDAQAKNFMAIVGDDRGELAPVLDVEPRTGEVIADKTRVTAWLKT